MWPVLAAVVGILLSSAVLPVTSTPHNPGSDACLCSFGVIPVAVDVKIPVDPSTGLNTTNLRRLAKTFNMFGQFCQPAQGNTDDRVQLLLHGSTYTHQYWSFPMNGFQNYSYVAHACAQGQTTFAYDQLGVGLSDRPANSSDVQQPVAAQIATSLAKKLKDGTVSSTLGLGVQRFRRVIAIGHSQGSAVLNFAALSEPTTSSIDALILTGHIHDAGFRTALTQPKPLARDVDPARWGNLDSGYVTTPNRTLFYPPDTSAFSSDVFMLDTLTKDVSVIWLTFQIAFVYAPAKGFKGPVVEMVGEFDQLHCFNAADPPCDADSLHVTEKTFWPDSRNLTIVVREGSGHDLDLDFGAAETFSLYSTLAQTMV